jgi:hypothetical protein
MVTCIRDILAELHRGRPRCPWYGFRKAEQTPVILMEGRGNGCPHAGPEQHALCRTEAQNLPIDWFECPMRRHVELATFLAEGFCFPAEVGAPVSLRDW